MLISLKRLFPRSFKNKYHLISAFLANWRFGFPARKLKVIGVTGTDGKTTTCYFIHSILTKAGIRAGLITTIEAKIGNKSYETGLHTTTPNPWELQHFLRRMVRAGCTHAVLEVTSHAIDQHRIWGIPFEIGVLTNITSEHLDYHKNLAQYEKVKRSFLASCRQRVDLTQKNELEVLRGKVKNYQLKLKGDYNYENVAAAYAVARLLEIDEDVIKAGIGSVKRIPGRMEVVYNQDFKVVIDFAHTAAALEKALQSARRLLLSGGRLMVIFGCAGERDMIKRRQMGQAASQLADKIVLTAEDPRNEDVNDIIDQITMGFGQGEVHRIPDRQEAINFAIQSAQPGDVIIITGKGHEQSMNIGGVEHPWSDFRAVEKAVKDETAL